MAKPQQWTNFFWQKYKPLIEKCSAEDVGIAIKACLAYFLTGEVPELSTIPDLLFSTISEDIDESISKYEQTCIKNKANRTKNQPLVTTGDDSFPTVTEEKRIEEKRKEIEKNRISERENKAISPTLQEVIDYCKERGNNIPAQRFYDYYSSVGWKKNGEQIADWKALLRSWETNNYGYGQTDNKPKPVREFIPTEL